MDRYTRQRGLVVQDLIADADLAVYGTGPALSYLLQCLALAGAATRHGHIWLCVDDRPTRESDLADQFLLHAEDLGRPIGDALADRVSRIDDTVDIAETAQPPERSLGIAVPDTAELAGLEGSHAITVWGQVLPTAVYIGSSPLREVPAASRNVLTAALSATCGGLLSQAVLGQLGAVIDGPAVVARWFEERLWLSYPAIGTAARAAQAEGSASPALGGVLERMGPGSGGSDLFRVMANGTLAQPRITEIVDENAVVVTVRVSPDATLPQVTIRPSLLTPPPVQPLLWSPVEGPVLNGDTVTGADVDLTSELPPARLVLCGVGALGSWASAVLAASRFPDLSLSLVDMDDSVETHNLNRQVLFGDSDVGQPKARRALERLATIAPEMRINALQVMITPEILDDLAGEGVQYELVDALLQPQANAYRTQIDALRKALDEATSILSCPDNHQTRWSLNVIAERLGIPLVNGAVDGFIGRVHVCDPGDNGRCLVCWLGESIALEPERRSCTDLLGEAPVPSIVTSAAIVGAAQAALLIARMASQQPIRRFHVFDGAENSLVGYRAADRDPEECPAHLLGPALGSSGPEAQRG